MNSYHVYLNGKRIGLLISAKSHEKDDDGLFLYGVDDKPCALFDEEIFVSIDEREDMVYHINLK